MRYQEWGDRWDNSPQVSQAPGGQRAPWDNDGFDIPGQHDPFSTVSERRSRGLIAGGVTGFLSAGVALGVANLAAAFVRPQASPIIAVGGKFIDLTPSWLKEFAIQKFGENDKNMLLLGMYVTIALLAIAIGMVAWRHIAVGIVGIGLFGALGAYIACTRPESRPADVIPSVIGGLVGVAALLWLTRSRILASHASLDPYRGTHRTEWAS